MDHQQPIFSHISALTGMGFLIAVVAKLSHNHPQDANFWVFSCLISYSMDYHAFIYN
jgi:hypothetical protein